MLQLKEQGLTHSLKKAQGSGKKRKKNDAANHMKDMELIDDNVKSLSSTQPSQVATNASDGIRNVGTASLTAKVLAEEQDRNKRRKTTENDNLKSLFSTSDGTPRLHSDFMTRGFSIPAGAKR